MKRFLLSGTMLLAGMSAVNAVEPVKDPATYQSVEGTYFQSLWMYSAGTDNGNPLINSGGTRGIACIDGNVYVPMRGEGDIDHQINVFNGNTGVLEHTYKIPKKLIGADIAYAFNDLAADSKGNLAACNLTLDIQNSGFHVWRMKKDAIDKPEELMVALWPQGQLKGLRIDFFDVYGDIYGDGYILAAIGGDLENYSDIVLKWDIVGGAVVADEPMPIWIQSYVPAATTNGTAPRVKAVSNDAFYFDGSNSHPALYDFEGNILDGFDTGGVCTKNSTPNGVVDFELGGRTFLAAAANNHGGAVGLPKNSAQLFDITDGMSAAKDIQLFPANGLGNLTPSAPSVKPVIHLIDENNANIFIHGASNGLAAYRLSLNPLSIDAEKASAMKVHVAGGELVFSEEAAKVDVYAVAGNCVAQYANVNRATLSLVKGIYIVKAVDMAGKTKVQKIVVG
ncbi:MAG: T9SS type A sorting domain-containing protein [Bacteroidales bacterium]